MNNTLEKLDNLDAAEVQSIVNGAIDRYIASRHGRVQAFVDANFSVSGSLRLHRHAMGFDLIRAPANVALMAPHLAAQLTASVAQRLGVKRAGQWLAHRKLFLSTDLARELTWRMYTDLLELPYHDGNRHTDRDALAEEMLFDARLAAVLDMLRDTILRHRSDPEIRTRPEGMVDTYAGTRNAAADLVVNLTMAGAGATLFKQLTPGVLSLGPALAGAIAYQAAVSSFPLGVGLGSLWYSQIGLTPSAGLVVGATGGLMAVAAVVTAFAGVVSDPTQKAFGLHHRRLHKLIDTMGHELKGESDVVYRVRDHYAARIFDLIDVTRATFRLAAG